MDGQSFDAAILSRVPLAEAVLTLLRYVLDPLVLNELYEQARGRSYQRILSFPDTVGLVNDCLLGPAHSGRASLLDAQERDALLVTPRAFYDKLAKMPPSVSAAFLSTCSARLRDAVPDDFGELPVSLAQFAVTIADGKVIKNVPRRLRPLRYDRQTAKKLLGGRALVATDLRTGLALALCGEPDGECNEIRIMPEFLAALPEFKRRPLFVGDRAFGTVEQAGRFLERGDFVLRLPGQTPFEPDETIPTRTGTDRFGRAYSEDGGWICRGGHEPRRIPVRRLTLKLNKETLVLITSLSNTERYPGDDLLEIYLQRWNIERVFQEITSVFQLNRLIGTTPQATLFQLAFCLLVYNVIRVIKHYVARAGKMKVNEVSSEMLFRDVRDQLAAVAQFLSPARMGQMIPELPTAIGLRQRLQGLLGSCWRPKWRKANYSPRDPTRPAPAKPTKLKQNRAHDSVYRILQRSK
jgi:hypothetical protein